MAEATEQTTLELRPARFSIEVAGDDAVFDGFTSGQTWNGWQCPYFTLEQGQAIVEAINRTQDEWSREPTNLDTLHGLYDSMRDAFVFYQESAKDSDNPDEDWEIFTFVEVDGQKLYPIGAWCWIWERAD